MNYYKLVCTNSNTKWMTSELEQGRVRFGWSSSDCDLRKIKMMSSLQMNDEQRLSWRMTKFLCERLIKGDHLIIQLEQPLRQFYIAEVIGDYTFDQSLKADFNHIIPIKLLSNIPVKVNSNIVSNNMRNDLSKRGQYYCIYPEKTVQELNEIVSLQLWNDIKANELTSIKNELEKTNELIRNQCIKLISQTWKSKHFESFVYYLLSAIPNISVKRLADSGKGWDMLIQIQDPISGTILHDDVPVQCKNYYGEVYTSRPIQDLVRSIQNSDSNIAYLVILGKLTEQFLIDFEKEKNLLKSSSRNIDLILIDQDQIADLYMTYKSTIKDFI